MDVKKKNIPPAAAGRKITDDANTISGVNIKHKNKTIITPNAGNTNEIRFDIYKKFTFLFTIFFSVNFVCTKLCA